MDDVDVLVRKGDTRQLDVTITDESGTPLNLEGSTVEVVVYDWTRTELWRASATVDPDQDARRGRVTYAWTDEQVATPGNYYLLLEVEFAGGPPPVAFPTEGPLRLTVAEPAEQVDPIVVDPASVARRIGIPDAEFEGLREVLEDAIFDAQTDVEGYLRRPVQVTRFTEVARFDPTEPGSGSLAAAFTPRAPGNGLALAWDPVVRVVSVTDNGDGTAVVVYLAGLDLSDRRHRPILRWIRAAAADDFLSTPRGARYRAVTSKSAGGQSISWEKPSGGAAWAGSAPPLEVLSRFRKRGVYSRPRGVASGATVGDAFGYGGGGIDWQPPDGLFLRDDRTGEVSPT